MSRPCCPNKRTSTDLSYGITKPKTLKKFTLLNLFTFSVVATAMAQDDTAFVTEIVGTPNYLIVVICGVLLAFGFQYLLTALSVAIGLTAVPNAKEAYAKAKARPDDPDRTRFRASGTPRYVREGNVTIAVYEDDDDHDNKYDNDGADGAPIGVTISSALGIWNAITTAIALFAATLLALHLSAVLNEHIAITLALTIWATFFMLLFWLESRFASTVIGGLVSAATSGLKSAGEAVKNMVAPSPVDKVADRVESTMADLESHLSDGFDTDKLVDAINNFGKKVEKNTPSYDQLKSDLEDIVRSGAEAGQKGGGGNPAKWTAIQSVIQTVTENSDGSGGDDSPESKERKQKLKDLMADLKATYDKEGLTQEGVKDALKNADVVDDATVDKYMDKIGSVFSGSGEADFSKEGLLKKMQGLIDEGELSVDDLSKEKVREKLKGMDRTKVTELVAANTALNKDQIDNYVDQAMSVLEMVQGKLAAVGVTGNANGTGGADAGVLAQAQKLVMQYLGGTDGKDGGQGAGFDFNSIKKEVMAALADPKDSVSTVRKRLASMDRDTLTKTLIDNTSLSRADIDEAVHRVDTMRADLETKLIELETKARATLRQTERQAVIQAEHARKTAVAAAWWLVVAIVVSGAAAVAGAFV